MSEATVLTAIEATQEDKPNAEPEHIVLHKRIGSTNYKVAVHFSKTSRETIDDKILRLIKNDTAKGAGV
jgi:hypothetical protein